VETSQAEQARVEWEAVWNSPVQRVIGVGRRVYNRYLKRVFLPEASSSKSFLEIGCGTASLLCDVAPSFGSVVGLDISDTALEVAQRRAKDQNRSNASFVLGDCFNLPFADGTFDIIWSQGLHEHFSNYIEIFREEYRVCKSGGCVYAGCHDCQAVPGCGRGRSRSFSRKMTSSGPCAKSGHTRRLL
jgi:ubiquinone/menaquinone biosynthesis C-methylase UbiE